MVFAVKLSRKDIKKGNTAVFPFHFQFVFGING